MATKPLLFRTSLRDAATSASPDTGPTLREPLPAVIECEAGLFVETGTRVTEVKLETTDDS